MGIANQFNFSVGSEGEGAERPKRQYNRRFQRRRRQPRRDRQSGGEGEGDIKKEDTSDKEGILDSIVTINSETDKMGYWG